MKKAAIILFVLMSMTILSQAQVSNPRSPAEWEEQQAIVMGFVPVSSHPDLPWDESVDPFVKVAQACINENIKFYIFDGTDELYGVGDIILDTVFSNRGINSPLVEIIEVDYDVNPWLRDHGMFSVYENQVGDLHLYKYADDNSSGDSISNRLNLPLAQMPYTANNSEFYYDGGNWLSDGHGTFNIAAVHELDIIDNNTPLGKINNSIPQSNYLGVSQTLNVLGMDWHIDYYLKLLDEETLVVSYIPPSNAHPDVNPVPGELEAWQHKIDTTMIMIGNHLQSAFGRDFEIIPIQNAPSDNNIPLNVTTLTNFATYTNSLIINKTVLVPQYVSQPYDSLALDAYEAAMPGYNIVGVNCRQFQESGGTIHCLTKEIYANDPIYIKHAWYEDTVYIGGDYPIEATVMSNLGLSDVSMFWSTDPNGPFQEVTMSYTSGDVYVADIPHQSANTTIYYYIAATDNNLKTISKPFVAPDGLYQFVAGGGTTAVADFNTSNNIKIYPNPTSGIIYISDIISDKADISIISPSGRVIDKIKANGNNLNVDVQKYGIATGIYFVKIQDENGYSVYKIMFK